MAEGSLSTGATVALRLLAKTDHTTETVFRGFAGDPPIRMAEACELAKAGLAESDGKTLRLTPAGAVKVDSLDKWLEGR